MNTLYTSRCDICNENSDTGFEIVLPEQVTDRVLKRIYGHFNVKDDIDPELFAFTSTYLDEAIEKGFGSVKWGEPDYAFLQELKYNNAVFAAFKTHRQQNDLAILLLDEEGKQRSYHDFRKASEAVIGAYNTTWLKTEHDTATKSARTASRFKAFEKDEDLFPNLKWLRSRAVTPRDAHKPYYNNVRRLSDSWWKTHYPGCVYGCQCDFKNTDEPITHIGDEPVNALSQDNPETSPGLDRNPAMTGSIFTDSHPYIRECYPGAQTAVANFLKSKRKRHGNKS